jgi:outer membrane lipoprotein LolB
MSPAVRAFGACALLLLAACAARPLRETLPPVAEAPAAHQARRAAALESRPDWTLQGRVALSNGRDGGSGRLDWTQAGDVYTVSLAAPITRQSWRLSGGPGGATLEGLEGGPRTGADPTTLLRAATRWEIPVAALADWVRGLPADEEAHGPAQLDFGADGRLARVAQDGWVIDYTAWAAVDGVELPVRLNARRGEASVRLVVDAWLVGDLLERATGDAGSDGADSP